MPDCINIYGAGLAGCEAALAAARAGVRVKLTEMKPTRYSPAHKSSGLAELVCSNSLKAKQISSASGLLKAEMQMLGSAVVEAAYASQVPAGGALAVDRQAFSDYIEKLVAAERNIEIIRGEATAIPQDGITVVAAGPLCDGALAESIGIICGEKPYFYDAVAPIVAAESIDMSKAFIASRYDRGGGDYINCPMDKEEYTAFWNALTQAQTAPLHEFDEKPKVYEGCMPIETLAKRGADSIRYGPMKPVGLRNPKDNKRPYAVLQLRAENAEKTMYNLVGFQTNLKFSEQQRVFGMIPALKNAEYYRYGVMHRNTYIYSPGVLSADMSLKANPNVFFCGQICGVEGYCESAMTGIIAGINAAARQKNLPPVTLSGKSMSGSLIRYITDSSIELKNFAPMGANFGILPRPAAGIRDKRERYTAAAKAALRALCAELTEKGIYKGPEYNFWESENEDNS